MQVFQDLGRLSGLAFGEQQESDVAAQLQRGGGGVAGSGTHVGEHLPELPQSRSGLAELRPAVGRLPETEQSVVAGRAVDASVRFGEGVELRKGSTEIPTEDEDRRGGWAKRLLKGERRSARGRSRCWDGDRRLLGRLRGRGAVTAGAASVTSPVSLGARRGAGGGVSDGEGCAVGRGRGRGAFGRRNSSVGSGIPPGAAGAGAPGGGRNGSSRS